MKIKIKIPSEKEVNEWIEKKWTDIDRYQDEVIKNVFEQHPLNTDMNAVMIKVSLLKDYYSAPSRYVKTYEVAEGVVACNIDDKLKDGDGSVVNDIQKRTGQYVFATKYCHFHKPETFPIFDSKVEIALKYFKNNFGFDFTIKELRDYEKYKGICDRFIDEFELEKNYKKIDEYLWLVGKALS